VRVITPYLALSLVVAGCASPRAPTLAADGYSLTPISAGCYGQERERNVALTPEFQRSLITQLSEAPNDALCWRERSDDTLFLAIGSECGPHREAEFQRRADGWTLTSEREVPIVLCDERSR
jgi:hypothetical protein